MSTFVQPTSATFMQDFAKLLQKAGRVEKFRIIRDSKLGFGVEAKTAGTWDGLWKRLGFGTSGPKYDLKSHVKELESIVEKKLAHVAVVLQGSPDERSQLAEELIKAYLLLDRVTDVCSYVAYRATAPRTTKVFSHSLLLKQKECFQAVRSLIPIPRVSLACRLGEYEMAIVLCKAEWPALPLDLPQKQLVKLLRFAHKSGEMDLFYAIFSSLDKEGMQSFMWDSGWDILKHAIAIKDVAGTIRILKSTNDSAQIHYTLTATKRSLPQLSDWCVQRPALLNTHKRDDSLDPDGLIKEAIDNKDLERIDFLLRNNIHPTAKQQEQIEELRATKAFSQPDHHLVIGREKIAINWQYAMDHVPNMKTFPKSLSTTRLDAQVHNAQGVQDYFDSLTGTYRVEDERELARALTLVMQAHRFGDERLVERSRETVIALFAENPTVPLLSTIRAKVNALSANLFEKRYEVNLVSALFSRAQAPHRGIVAGLEFALGLADKLAKNSFTIPLSFFHQYLLEPLKLSRFIPEADKERGNALFKRQLLQLEKCYPTSYEYFVALRAFDAGRAEEGLRNLLAQTPDDMQTKRALRDLYIKQKRFDEVVDLFKDERNGEVVDQILLAYALKKTGKPFDIKDLGSTLNFYFFPETQESFIRSLRNNQGEVLASIQAYCEEKSDLDLDAPSPWERDCFDTTNPVYPILEQEVFPKIRTALRPA